MKKKLVSRLCNSKNLSVKIAIDKFLETCKAKGLQNVTVDYYKNYLEVFTKWKNLDDTLVSNIDINIINDYIIFLRQKYPNNTSVNTSLRALRAFIYYCIELNYCEPIKIRLVKEEESVKLTYTDDELLRLLHKPNTKECTFTTYRNWVIVNFLLGTGIRLSTLIHIKIKDINLNDCQLVTTHNKNHKQQIIPLSKQLVKVMIEYMSYRQHESNDEYLFPSESNVQMTDNSVKHAMRKYGKDRNVKQCGCHRFRHTFAKNWILSGGDAFRLQKMLGHSTMEITRKYVNIFGSELARDLETFNALDRLSVDKKKIKMK